MGRKGPQIRYGAIAPSADSRDNHYSTAPASRPAWMQDRTLLPKRPPTASRREEGGGDAR